MILELCEIIIKINHGDLGFMKNIFIKNAEIVTDKRIISGNCFIENGKIGYIGDQSFNSECVIDAKGAYLMPGFIDLHCHGGNGYEFMDASLDEIGEIAQFHLRHGTTTMLATTMASSEKELNVALENLSRYKREKPGSSILGIHLEGPWLNPMQCGAQNVKYMSLPDSKKLEELKKKFPLIMRASVAPELPGGMEMGIMGRKLGILMSYAHTDADFTVIEKAFENGYALATHLYSGMNGVTRKNSFRTAGAVEAGLYMDGIIVEIIADGRHLPEELLKYVYKIKGADGICLITDAIRAAGMKNGSKTVIGSFANGIPVVVEDDVAKLPDRQSFAGSATTFDRMIKIMAHAIGNDAVALAKMSATTPAKVLGLTDTGVIETGKDADIVLLDRDWCLNKVIYKGEIVG